MYFEVNFKGHFLSSGDSPRNKYFMGKMVNFMLFTAHHDDNFKNPRLEKTKTAFWKN